jgi:NAD(P)-dependent dehydrogenase (short-subunit alcohol dehydrogenase family)
MNIIVQELAYQYAKKGACLSLVARRKQALEGVAAAALERGAPDVLVIPADVSDAEQSRRAVEATVAHFGKRTRPSLYLHLAPAHGHLRLSDFHVCVTLRVCVVQWTI